MSPREVVPVPEADTILTIPNLITLVRILLIIPFVHYVNTGQDRRALVIFFIAGVSDTIDGTIARVFHQSSKLGRLIDPVADKVLAGIAYVVMSLFRDGRSAIPVWVMAFVITRDILILLGCAIIYFKAHTTAFRPTLAGKLNTFIELITLGLFLGVSLIPAIATILPVLYIVLAISIVISFSGYVRQGIGMLR
jgi:cardiolipin synthase